MAPTRVGAISFASKLRTPIGARRGLSGSQMVWSQTELHMAMWKHLG